MVAVVEQLKEMKDLWTEPECAVPCVNPDPLSGTLEYSVLEGATFLQPLNASQILMSTDKQQIMDAHKAIAWSRGDTVV